MHICVQIYVNDIKSCDLTIHSRNIENTMGIYNMGFKTTIIWALKQQ